MLLEALQTVCGLCTDTTMAHAEVQSTRSFQRHSFRDSKIGLSYTIVNTLVQGKHYTLHLPTATTAPRQSLTPAAATPAELQLLRTSLKQILSGTIQQLGKLEA